MPGLHSSLAEDNAFSVEVPPQSIGASSAVNGTGVDMMGWDGVLFCLALGVVDGTQDMKAQSDDNSGFSSAVDIPNAAITQMLATDDNKMSMLDVYKPPERYVRAVVTNGAGAAADFQSVIAIRYRATGRLPVTQDTSIKELKKVISN